jgi:diguanylate cyclase (GGDEF)-like protein
MAGGTSPGDRLQRLIESWLALDDESEPARVSARLAADAEKILGQPVAMLSLRRLAWRVDARSSAAPIFSPGTTPLGAAVDVARGLRDTACVPTLDGSAWTLVALAPSPPTVIAIRGDWLDSSPQLVQCARALSALRRASLRASAARLQTAVQRLTIRLTRAGSPNEVCTIALRSMADAVGARLAAFALPDALDQRLSVVATRGYPLDLVRHLRIQAGEGVIGSVYASGRMLVEKRLRGVPGRKTRPRYRTDSFIAAPIRAGRAVVGVVCVTDRAADGPFSRRDAATLRAMAAPTALAIGRETALVQMREFARGATIDPVSGSFNRRHFQSRLEEELQRSRRDGLTVALLMIDIDDFKKVNDAFGHLTGDMVIRDVAEILRRSVRVFDVCARFGGEEFAVLMPASSIASAAKAAGRICERIESYRWRESGLEELKVTASVGLAVSVQDSITIDLIARADAALYAAKREGKNRVRVSPPEGDAIRRVG